jgi:hypothetical protein
MATRAKATLPVNYNEQLAREAAEISKRIATPSGDRVRFNSNRGFVTPDGNEGEELEVVIVDFMSSNLFYDGPFDRDKPQPPACFAIGPEPSLLVPSDNSPNKQAEVCTVCPNNQFGSAGKGKACKNTRLLAVMPLAMDGGESPIWIMSVPPTSMKAFDGYVSTLASKHKTIPVGVVTRITLDQTVQFAAPRFTVVRPLDGSEIGTYMANREEARTRLAMEPDVSQYVPPAQTAPSRGQPMRRGVR